MTTAFLSKKIDFAFGPVGLIAGDNNSHAVTSKANNAPAIADLH